MYLDLSLLPPQPLHTPQPPQYPPSFFEPTTESDQYTAEDGKKYDHKDNGEIENDDDYCPTEAQHRLALPASLLERWPTAEYNLESAGCNAMKPKYVTREDYIRFHPSFRRQWNLVRAHELLFIQGVHFPRSSGGSEICGAAIWYSIRCQYCRMIGRGMTFFDGRKPCFDPFIEARDGRVKFDLPGVVAFFDEKKSSTHNKGTIIMRADWSWKTLGNMGEVVAVYSKRDMEKQFHDTSFDKSNTTNNNLKKGLKWWSFLYTKKNKQNVALPKGILYLEDILDEGAKET